MIGLFCNVRGKLLYFNAMTEEKGFVAMREFGHFGRLGNQMFQLAFLTAAAKDQGLDVMVAKPNSHDSKHCYQIEHVFKCCPQKWNPANTLQLMMALTETKEFARDYKFDIIADKMCINVCGYFQSWRYFHPHCETDIRALFTFRDDVQIDARKRWESLSIIKDHPTTSLHIRCGDYIGNVHHMVTPQYIRTAIALMPQNTQIVVFSDDIDWCRENIPIIVGNSNAIHFYNGTQGEDYVCNDNV